MLQCSGKPKLYHLALLTQFFTSCIIPAAAVALGNRTLARWDVKIAQNERSVPSNGIATSNHVPQDCIRKPHGLDLYRFCAPALSNAKKMVEWPGSCLGPRDFKVSVRLFSHQTIRRLKRAALTIKGDCTFAGLSVVFLISTSCNHIGSTSSSKGPTVDHEGNACHKDLWLCKGNGMTGKSNLFTWFPFVCILCI